MGLRKAGARYLWFDDSKFQLHTAHRFDPPQPDHGERHVCCTGPRPHSLVEFPAGLVEFGPSTPDSNKNTQVPGIVVTHRADRWASLPGMQAPTQ